LIPAIAKYAGLRVPRYTSYPTAPYFSAATGEKEYSGWLQALDAAGEVSLYLHVPFCRRMCWYCGCNMRLAARYDPVAAYVQTISEEIAMVADALPARMRVSHIHWGGGTPTAIEPDDFLRLTDLLHEHFDIKADVQHAVELDPRTFTQEMAVALGKAGCTRTSLGVQEFDIQVQRAINRIQPLDTVRQTVNWLRENGVTGVNFDLMYGLPHQTLETLLKSVDDCMELRPDRIALFGYAHVPWMAKNQRMIPESTLPDSKARFDQAETAGSRLEELGYQRIGLDHFALPDDSLAIAAREGRMRRNFQGYTDDAAEVLIGFGASAISSGPSGYTQNITETGAYTLAVKDGRLPVAKGLELQGDDILRRRVIEQIMCDMHADLAATAVEYGEAEDYFDTEIAALVPMADDGLIDIEDRTVTVLDHARPALRIVAAAFDRYFTAANQEKRHAAAV
jgi:oxygen-independent coproporphyrinogen-3 oxidase